MSDPSPNLQQDTFAAAASHSRQRGLVPELLGFMRETRAWWMAPILAVFALVAALLVLGASGVAPFLYPLF